MDCGMMGWMDRLPLVCLWRHLRMFQGDWGKRMRIEMLEPRTRGGVGRLPRSPRSWRVEGTWRESSAREAERERTVLMGHEVRLENNVAGKDRYCCSPVCLSSGGQFRPRKSCLYHTIAGYLKALPNTILRQVRQVVQHRLPPVRHPPPWLGPEGLLQPYFAGLDCH